MNLVFVNAVHYLGFALMMSALVLEMNLFKPQVSGAVARKLARADALYGISALAVLATGLLRLFVYGKPVSYYGHNFLFHIKVTLFLVAILISIFAAIKFIRQRSARDDEKVIYPGVIGVLIKVELALLVIIPFLAVMMAHGYGMAG